MKLAFSFFLVLLIQICVAQQSKKVFIWDCNLHLVDSFPISSYKDLHNINTYNKLKREYVSENAQLNYLIYYGSSINNFSFKYNPIDKDHINISFIMPDSLRPRYYLLENRGFTYYDSIDTPTKDFLPDGIWLNLTHTKNSFFIRYSKEIVDGKLHGILLELGSNNEIVEKSIYENGYITQFYKMTNNTLDTIMSFSYNKHGRVKEGFYYQNGKLTGHVNEKLGISLHLHHNGTLYEFGHIKDGLPEGKYSYYDENGKIESDVYFRKGRPISIKKY